MDLDFTRRTLLQTAGASSLTVAAAAAARAEGTTPGAIIAGPTFATRAPMHIGSVTLRVRSLDTVLAFYRDVIGLAVMTRDDKGATMGVNGLPLIALEARPQAKIARTSAAGLYHTAFLMPTRTDLSQWLVHVARNRTPLAGFADHLVSESVYLNDPEGNGVEVYSDRDPSQWKWQDGGVAMATDPLNTDELLGLVDLQNASYAKAPEGLRIGHMHLRVGDLDKGARFYRESLGLDLTRERAGAAFLSSGRYHHHVAMNVWESARASKRDDTETGLAWFSLTVDSAERLAAQGERLAKAGFATAAIDNGIEAVDPWGTRVRLIRA